MLLVVDNGSIYTKNLTDFLNEKNISFKKQTPQLLNLNSLENYDGIILSGRKKNEKKINEINSKVITYSIKNNIKLLGICYGAEILALTLGGTIRKISSLQKGNETIKILKENPISDNSLDVFESHGFEISKLPSVLVALAESEHCQYEIIQYEKKPIFGTQFHPEMSQDGHDLIEKFCSL
ncbi:MAG TPA: gamma-glutamyl-gamma-aminobutyrate hydrolase family protein [Nitrosopumilus sp.]|nr:gamma-glutamyl-gamma-aminobutyrate hydrolase family protein [Thermoproteota archaeon]HJJ22644.1 gamma-glutamyl-gamma-aminobutyrate hydrolase family protein [Nitrosopumilus sp.]